MKSNSKGDVMKNIWMVLSIVLIVGAVICLPMLGQNNSTQKPEEFKAITTDGTTIKLSDYRGKAVIVDIFATWCPPCQKEVPYLINLQKKIEKDKLNLVILGVSTDTNKRTIQSYVKSKNINYPVAYYDSKEMKNFPAPSIPVKYILNKDGVMVDKMVGGPWTDEQLLTRVEKYLK